MTTAMSRRDLFDRAVHQLLEARCEGIADGAEYALLRSRLGMSLKGAPMTDVLDAATGLVYRYSRAVYALGAGKGMDPGWHPELPLSDHLLAIMAQGAYERLLSDRALTLVPSP
jgi:hypothetical protein